MFNALFQYLAYRCYMAAFRVPEGDMPIPCCVFKRVPDQCNRCKQVLRPPEQCKRCKHVFWHPEEFRTGFCEQGGHHVLTDECVQTQESRAFLHEIRWNHKSTFDDILRQRIEEYSKLHHQYLKFCQDKFGFVSAEDELGQIWPSDDGDDAVTTTTIDHPTPEVHKTATSRVLTRTRM